MEGLTHDRLTNVIIFVVMDQMLLAYEASQNAESSDEREYQSNVHDFLLHTREKPTRMNYIYDWVKEHLYHITDEPNVINPHLYEMITDGIVLLFTEHTQPNIDIGSLAFEYEKKYSQWN